MRPRWFPAALVLGGALLLHTPASAQDGNAPPLQSHRQVSLDPVVRGNLARHREQMASRTRGPLALTGQVKTLSSGGDLEVVSSVGTLTFDTVGGTFTDSTELTLKALTPLSVVYLYLYDLSSGGAKIADGTGELATQKLQNGLVSVGLGQQLAAGDTVTLTVTQSGVPQCQSSFLGLQTCMISPTMTYSLGAWRPQVYDMTTYQLLHAKTASLSITAPAGITVGATGVAGAVTSNLDGSQTYTFTSEFDDSFSFGAASYVSGSLAFGGGKTATTYLLGGNAGAGNQWRQAMADVMGFHAARYGPYDPSTISMVEVPDAAGAAYGPFTAIFMPTTTVSYPPTHWSTTTTLAHELGHQWFGGLIESGDSLSPWLNEGFATFAEMEYTSSLAGQEYGVDYLPTYRSQHNLTYIYSARAAGVDVPLSSTQIYQAPDLLYVAVTYDKGALVVGLLRYLMGDNTTFFDALKAYRKDHEGAVADVKSLKASLMKASGLDLTTFFNQWVFSSGYPTYKIEMKRPLPGAGGGAEVSVTCDKDFAVPVELDVVTADGNVSRVRLPVSSQSPTEFKHSVATTGEVLSVRFDPDKQLPGRALGQLPGDIHLNGEVDGIDLIYAAMAQGQSFDPMNPWQQGAFSLWADLVLDGAINQQDLDIVDKSFGKRTGE